MRRYLCLLMALLMLLLSACHAEETSETSEERMQTTETTLGKTESTQAGTPTTGQPANTTGTEATTGTTQATTKPDGGTTTEPTTAPSTEPTKPATQPESPTHSILYIPGVETEDVIRWYNEVVLDAEFANGGDATLVQKWTGGISYALLGEPTEEDQRVVSNMVTTLNSISGFPGMYETSNSDSANLKIHFVSQSEMQDIMGSDYSGNDGAVTFWYDGNNSIYKGVICIRTDLDQYVRNSVIQEEIYNGMGPVQDTDLRSDSLIYSGYSTPQQMTQVDFLIMTLLYNTKIRCGMTAAECEKVIRQLYY